MSLDAGSAGKHTKDVAEIEAMTVVVTGLS